MFNKLEFTVSMLWDFESGIIKIYREGEIRSKYMINNLHADSILLDIIRSDMDDTDKAQLKLAYPEIYDKIYVEMPATQELVQQLVNQHRGK